MFIGQCPVKSYELLFLSMSVLQPQLEMFKKQILHTGIGERFARVTCTLHVLAKKPTHN